MSWGDWRVIARDPDLALRGDLPWKTITLDDRHVDISTLQVTFTDTEAVRAKLGKGWGCLLLRNDIEVLPFTLEDDGDRTWEAGTDGKRGTIGVSYADDLAIAANELAYPDPAKSAAGNTGVITAMPVGPAPAETVIKTVVGANVGTGRTTARGDSSVPHQRLLTIAADAGTGDTVTYTPRFDNLMDVVKTISQAGSNIGVQVTQSGTSLVFDTYMPRDLTARMRFSREAQNLTAATTSISMPTVTHAVELGPQQYTGGTAVANTQVIREVKDATEADAWRMIVRQAVDATGVSGGTSTTAAEMDAQGTAALTAGIRAYARNVTLVETPQVRYRRDIRKGDLVAIVDPTRDGAVIQDIVSNFHVELDAGAGTMLIQFDVGTQDSSATSNDLVNALKIVKRKIRLLQQRTP